MGSMERIHVFDQLQCLPQPERWPGLRTFVMLESERTVGNQTSLERRYYISSLAPDAERIAHAIRVLALVAFRSSKNEAVRKTVRKFFIRP